MRWLWIAAITAGALTVASACQENAAAKLINSKNGPPDSPANGLIGTDVVAELNHSVDAKKVKPGDLVKATVTQDVLLRGKIVIRRGSKLVGHVTQTKPWSKDDQESRLGMVFDKAVLKGGGEIDFVAALRALAPGVREDLVDKPDPMIPSGLGGMGQSNNPQPINNGGSSRGRASTNPATSNTNTNNTTNQAAQAAQMSTATPVTTTKGGPAPSDFGVMGGGSRGIFGLPGLHLSTEPGGRGSILSSTSHNVRLDSGTQMVIQVNNLAQ
jgi:hypothetical protein